MGSHCLRVFDSVASRLALFANFPLVSRQRITMSNKLACVNVSRPVRVDDSESDVRISGIHTDKHFTLWCLTLALFASWRTQNEKQWDLHWRPCRAWLSERFVSAPSLFIDMCWYRVCQTDKLLAFCCPPWLSLWTYNEQQCDEKSVVCGLFDSVASRLALFAIFSLMSTQRVTTSCKLACVNVSRSVRVDDSESDVSILGIPTDKHFTLWCCSHKDTLLLGRHRTRSSGIHSGGRVVLSRLRALIRRPQLVSGVPHGQVARMVLPDLGSLCLAVDPQRATLRCGVSCLRVVDSTRSLCTETWVVCKYPPDEWATNNHE